MINIVDVFEKRRVTESFFVGEVIDNNDSKQIGRVRLRIPLYKNVSDLDLPWAVRFDSISVGSVGSVSQFAVPEKGSRVIVFFPFNDPHFPVYMASSVSEVNRPMTFLQSYPHSHGFDDGKGTKAVFDKDRRTFDFVHASGVTLNIDGSGKVEIVIPSQAVVKFTLGEFGDSATVRPVHDASPCPLFGVLHPGSSTIKIQP